MNSTTVRQLLKLGLKTPAELHPDFDGLVTFDAYVKAKAGVKMNEEQCEAFGRDVHGILAQLVFDNAFSIDSKRSLPRVENEFSLRTLSVWCEQVQTWFAGLPRGEQILFRSLKFLPVVKQ